jgi:release factor glutamine methyltransferase
MKPRVSIAEAILEASQSLRRAGVSEARREAGSLLAHVADKDRTFIISHAEDLLASEVLERLRECTERRAGGEPLQYITGRQEFFGREFEVNSDVLIPRPETELLVEKVLKLHADREEKLRICDVGTGSGCIAITLLMERPLTKAVALDISEPALRVAQRNAVHHEVNERLSFLRSDGLTSIAIAPVFDVIVSNPPYVATSALSGLQREVREHEPRTALLAGPDGLDVIRRLLIESGPRLAPSGFLIFEFGFDQGSAVKQLVGDSDWKMLDIDNDLQGIPRIVALQKPA